LNALTTKEDHKDYIQRFSVKFKFNLNAEHSNFVSMWIDDLVSNFVETWIDVFGKRILIKISRNTYQTFPFRRWSAPLTDHSFFEIHEGWPRIRSFNRSQLFWNTGGMAWDLLFNSRFFLCFCLNCVCVVCLYPVAFHGEEPRRFIICICIKKPPGLDIWLYLKWKCFLLLMYNSVTLCLWVCPPYFVRTGVI